MALHRETSCRLAFQEGNHETNGARCFLATGPVESPGRCATPGLRHELSRQRRPRRRRLRLGVSLSGARFRLEQRIRLRQQCLLGFPRGDAFDGCAAQHLGRAVRERDRRFVALRRRRPDPRGARRAGGRLRGHPSRLVRRDRLYGCQSRQLVARHDPAALQRLGSRSARPRSRHRREPRASDLPCS